MSKISAVVFLALPFFLLILSSHSAPLFANNLSVSNVSVAGWDASAKTCQVRFDITWNNAWRDTANYDATWVFVKYSTDGGATWNHATLASQGHSTAPGIEVVVPPDYKGAFIQFSGITSDHTLIANGTKLVWDYSKDGVTDSQVKDGTNTKVRVFGIEMVYIPQGPFSAGDTSSTAALMQGSADADPWSIIGEGPIQVINVATNSYYYTTGGNAGEDATGSVFMIPTTFPKGFAAFYLMKYEISQGQYRDFLNTLTRAQQNTRTSVQTAGIFSMSDSASMQNRNGIRNPETVPEGAITFGCDYTPETFDQTNDGEWIAMNYLSWMDLAAYADWAALRPITELEYEKACRGPNAAVSGEYAWGDTTLEPATLTLSFAATSGETPNQGNMNYSSSSPNGPFRVGAFARSTSTRTNAGAGYYGNLDLSGNVLERTVTIGNAVGRAFLGTNGNGILTSNGNADVTDWPGFGSGEVTGAAGSGFRGGGWSSISDNARVSYRGEAAKEDATRGNIYGGRLGRMAPS